jgi:hypothetical protein
VREDACVSAGAWRGPRAPARSGGAPAHDARAAREHEALRAVGHVLQGGGVDDAQLRARNGQAHAAADVGRLGLGPGRERQEDGVAA